MNKKEYIRPVVINKEVIETDQSIAACNVINSNYELEFLGYTSQWNGGYASQKVDELYSTLPKTIEAANTVYNGQPLRGIYACYYVDGSTKEWVGYYEDFDMDGKFDKQGGDGWQSVQGNHSEVWSGYFQS